MAKAQVTSEINGTGTTGHGAEPKSARYHIDRAEIVVLPRFEIFAAVPG